jgi:glucoamylase
MADAAPSGSTGPIRFAGSVVSTQQSSLPAIAQHLFDLMMRNMASDGFAFEDPLQPGSFSAPGCIVASPSYPADLGSVNQDYVFNWTRDAAVTAREIAAAQVATEAGQPNQSLVDYLAFARTCQSTGVVDRGCYTIEGKLRDWTDQSDGPALRVLAILAAWPALGAAAQAVASQVAATDVDYLLGAYQNPTTNLWEERAGQSFFARAVQLACLKAVAANTVGLAVPPGVAGAITWLEQALAAHWNGSIYLSVLDPTPAGYDPNIDVVLAAIYGAVAVTDERLLATAAALRRQWEEPSSPVYYPINGADAARGIGPVLGRYPGDSYDGDTNDPVPGGHPWPLSTAHFAELYYRLAAAIARSGTVPLTALSAPFFAQVGVAATTAPGEAVTALRAAGDRMLQAVVFHSDHLELSEQFDGTTGYEKSVHNLTWSYAAFLSAVRARTGQPVEG